MASDSIIDRELNTWGKESGLTLVNPDAPVDWGRLAKTLIGALVALVYAGQYAVLTALGNLFAGPWSALASFGEDVAATFGEAGMTTINTAVTSTTGALTSLPLGLGWVVGIAVLTGSLYIVARGIEVVRSG